MTANHSLSGVRYLIHGFEWLVKPGIKRFVIIPLIINMLLFSFIIGAGFHLVQYVIHFLPHWLHWLTWLIWPIFFAASMIIVIYLFTLFANLIGAPLNSLLAEKVEIIATGQKPNDDEGIMDALKDSPRTFKREWQKIRYYLPRAIIVLLCFWIPIVGAIAGILWFIFGCWMMAVQYLDYPIDNHRLPFQSLHDYLKQNRWEALGFGLAVIVLSMIPILNFAVMPAAVIGGTLMYTNNPN